jgi:hypothetical protein
MRTSRIDILINRFYEPWWKNVIIFYAGISGDVSDLLQVIQTRSTLVDQRGLLSDIQREARFTSPIVRDFLADGLDVGDFNEDNENEEENFEQ